MLFVTFALFAFFAFLVRGVLSDPSDSLGRFPLALVPVVTAAEVATAAGSECHSLREYVSWSPILSCLGHSSTGLYKAWSKADRTQSWVSSFSARERISAGTGGSTAGAFEPDSGASTAGAVCAGSLGL